MAKGAAPRDVQIAELVSKFKMAIVEADEIPAETHLEVDDGPELMVSVGDKVVKQTNFLSFVISGKQYTAPSTAIKRLRRVKVDHADGTSNLVVRGVQLVDEFADIVEVEELNAEMYHWGHQVYMVSYNDDAHPEYNVVIHVSRFCDDGHWHTLDYVAGVEIDKQYVNVKGLRNSPGVI
jgi:hypothetical protein